MKEWDDTVRNDAPEGRFGRLYCSRPYETVQALVCAADMTCSSGLERTSFVSERWGFALPDSSALVWDPPFEHINQIFCEVAPASEMMGTCYDSSAGLPPLGKAFMPDAADDEIVLGEALRRTYTEPGVHGLTQARRVVRQLSREIGGKTHKEVVRSPAVEGLERQGLRQAAEYEQGNLEQGNLTERPAVDWGGVLQAAVAAVEKGELRLPRVQRVALHKWQLAYERGYRLWSRAKPLRRGLGRSRREREATRRTVNRLRRNPLFINFVKHFSRDVDNDW